MFRMLVSLAVFAIFLLIITIMPLQESYCRTQAAAAMSSQISSPSPSPSPSPSESPSASASPSPSPSLSSVPVEDLPTITKISGTLELGNEITLKVPGLADYMQTSERDFNLLVPILNGKMLSGTHPSRIDPDREEISFYLARKEESKEAWDTLFRKPWCGTREVFLSASFEDGPQFRYSYARPIFLTIVPTGWFMFGLFVTLLCLVVFFWFAATSDMLRDGPKIDARTRRPYSLGRTQMAFWFCLITIAYLFINLITWQVDTITPSLLALLGISATTAISASAINASNSVNIISAIESKRDEVNKLTALLATIVDREIQANLRMKINTLNQEIAILSREPTTKGFITDLIYDRDTISLHRVQIVIWTLILGSFFISSVAYYLTMPEFNATLLALIGISSGTYLGFKYATNETKTS